jgi:ABC-type branched-subunit amino acid transport system ATPase component
MKADVRAAPLFECRSVSKSYGALRAVVDLSLSVADGEILGIGGPNGAGKTTLFDLISGVTRPDKGSIVLNNFELIGCSPDRICHLGVARTFQFNAAFDSLTVLDNVLAASYFGGRRIAIPGLWIDRESKHRAEAAIDQVGLTSFIAVAVNQLPVLQRKLLMIATALATRPRLLLLDEPVGGLTVSEIDGIASIVGGLRRSGLAIVLIEHVMRFMAAVGDRIVIMHHGQKIFDGSASEMIDDATVVDVYLGTTTAAELRTPGAQG